MRDMMPNGRHDGKALRRARQSGRQRGVSIYLAAEELERSGLPIDGSRMTYAVAVGERGRFVVTLHPAMHPEE
jgi:hypothetical protein